VRQTVVVESVVGAWCSLSELFTEQKMLFAVLLVALCALSNMQLVSGQCATPHLVNDTYTADPPVFYTSGSGFKANDVL
jgi:hypothetical protein